MFKHILKRILFLPILLGLISVLAFTLVRLAPGGPFDRERKPASRELENRIREKYHLDEPVWKQYLRYAGGLIRGDLGPSLKYRNHSVTDIVVQGLPVSMALGLGAFVMALGVGIPLGLGSVVLRGGVGEVGAVAIATILICIPSFVIGPVLVMQLAIRWKLFPVALLDSPLHSVLPILTLGLYFAGRIARLLREGLLAVRNADFIRTARAKGLGETEILFKHSLRVGLLPVISYCGPMLADLLTGSFVVENLFQIPGIGVFMVNSSLSRDYTMIVGLVLVYALILLILNLLVDSVYSLLDPRIRNE